MGNYSKEFKIEKLNEATQKCAKILIPLMKVLEIPNFVETKIIVNNDEVYKIRIEKIKQIDKESNERLHCFQCEIEMPVVFENNNIYCKNCGLKH